MNSPTYPGRASFNEARARSTDPETSKAAGRAVDASRPRSRIMEVMRVVPLGLTCDYGWTADELDDRLGEEDPTWRLTTAGRRLSELKRRGLVVDTGHTRLTRSGRSATVYRVVS